MEDLNKALENLKATSEMLNKATKDKAKAEKEAFKNFNEIIENAPMAHQATVAQKVGQLKKLIAKAKQGGDINKIIAQMKALNK